jgi:hypothetical protein
MIHNLPPFLLAQPSIPPLLPLRLQPNDVQPLQSLQLNVVQPIQPLMKSPPSCTTYRPLPPITSLDDLLLTSYVLRDRVFQGLPALSEVLCVCVCICVSGWVGGWVGGWVWVYVVECVYITYNIYTQELLDSICNITRGGGKYSRPRARSHASARM